MRAPVPLSAENVKDADMLVRDVLWRQKCRVRATRTTYLWARTGAAPPGVHVNRVLVVNVPKSGFAFCLEGTAMSFMHCVLHYESGARISGPGIPRTRPAAAWSLRLRSNTIAITRRTIILLDLHPRAVVTVSPRISR